MRKLFSFISTKWDNYKHRFLPWLVLNFDKKSKPNQFLSLGDPEIVEQKVFHDLTTLLNALEATTVIRLPQTPPSDKHKMSLEVMLNTLGFVIDKKRSSITKAGYGVFVTQGRIKKGSLAALYPGTVYRRFEPLLIQSLANPYLFRCVDGVHIDGHHRLISKSIYKSCVYRDRIGPHLMADLTWLTPYPVNPLNVGQVVNNETSSLPCNVTYEEYEINQLPIQLWKFLPNIYYSANITCEHWPPLRIVALIALRDISAGEELFSSYLTVVPSHKASIQVSK